MRSYLYSFAVELSGYGWSRWYEVTSRAGNRKAAMDQVDLLAKGWSSVKIKYIRGSRTEVS